MDDRRIDSRPAALDDILSDTGRLGFSMASEPLTGSLLRALAASKPGGRFLELGTGTGVGASWLLAGMDARSHLDTVDTDPAAQEIARRHLGADPRVSFHLTDGADFLARAPEASFDLVYADAWPGKYSHLDRALALVRPGGIYFADDFLPQPNWPDGHGEKASALIADLDRRPGFVAVKLAWASGLMILVRTAG